MRIALLADIHGNSWALRAVLEHARKQGVREFVDLGDILYGPLDPLGTYELLRELGAASIQGNGDRLIHEATPEALANNPTLAWVVDQLGAGPVEWLRALPATHEFGERMLACHGSPSSDTEYLLEDVASGRPAMRSIADIRERLGGVDARLIACGHTHIPRFVQLPGARAILNPGSVGLPAYDDNLPVTHFMETFAPHASYAVLEDAGNGWAVSFHRVPYDHETAAARARELGREDWARGIATGWMST